MPLLRTLGSVALVDHTTSGERHLDVQQKRLALLVFLARGGRGHFVRRDVLLSLFWPDTDDQHGRGVLRQALTAFRKHLGAEVLVTRGEDEVGLASEGLSCDATAFEEACRSGEYEVACALYQGHFLAGFHATGVAPEFEQWVDVERDQLRRLAGDASWRVALQLEAAGHAAEAVACARSAVDLDPDDEKGVAHLISMLDRQGDRSGALTVYGALERRLADGFSAQPAPETRALMRALRQRPTPVSLSPSSEPTEPASSAAPVEPTGDASIHLPPGEVPSREAQRSRRHLLIAGAIGALAMVMLVALLGPARPAQDPRSGKPARLAVVPFRVHASDSAMSWLREGMVELLTMRLAGSEALQVVEPGVVLTAWHLASPDGRVDASREVLRRVADEAGATRIVQGSISGTPEHLILAAWVLAMPGGRTESQASIEGPADSLPVLVDRLSARLLGLTTGLEGHRLASLEGVPPPAIRAFLAGRAEMRRGRPEVAAVRFREALTIDSTFAVAGMELWRAAPKSDADVAWGERVVRANQHRLSAPDRALYQVMMEQFRSAPEMFEKWNAAVSAYPDRPETWYGLGDSYYHWGMLAGIDNPLGKADAAFRKGWALDSAANGGVAFSGPLIAETMDHLVVLAHLRGDTAEVLRLTALVLSTDSSSDLATKLRWHRAAVQGLEARRAFWKDPGDADRPITGLVLFTLWTPVGADDHALAARENRRRFERRDLPYRSFALYFEAFNGGRPGDAPPPHDVEDGLRRLLAEAASWGGDSTAASEAARQLSQFADGPSTHGKGARARYWDICRLGLWRAASGDVSAGRTAAHRLRAGRVSGLAAADSVRHEHYRELCATLLDASSAVASGGMDAHTRLAIADSLARTYIFEVCCWESVSDANLILARLWEQLGDRPNALRAVRRRAGGFLLGPLYLSTFLREEGRLAALTGDTTGAIRAYRHYVALRPNPEPSARAEVEQVQQALAALGARPMLARAP